MSEDKEDKLKGENLICQGQRVLTKEGRDNWERTFKKKDNIKTGFGLAIIKEEGAPVHPLDMWTKDEEHYQRQLRAYTDYHEGRGKSRTEKKS